MQSIEGISASKGIAIGPAFVYHPKIICVDQRVVTDKAAELARFRKEVERSKQQLGLLQRTAQCTIGSGTAAIFEAQQMMLEDPALLSAIEDRIQKGENAEAALAKGINHFASILADLDDEYLRERAADVRDVGQRVLRALVGVEDKTLALINSPVIIIAQDLAPSDTALIRKEFVLGFCTAKGGITSHAVILARMIGLPAIVGAGDQVLQIQQGKKIILDGTNGKVILNTDKPTLCMYSQRQAAWVAIREAAKGAAQLPAVTRDGHRFQISANIGDSESAKKALEHGAEGVGLLRTEFLFLDRTAMPDEEEQYRSYLKVAKVMDKRPVIIRTLDIGGDKPVPYLQMGLEANPFLGLRAIRISLKQPDLFKTQLRAILRAGAGYNLKIMLPMIATLSEIERARQLLYEVQQELTQCRTKFVESIELGIMVEIPSAAITSDLLATEVDFFSIGTNDLTQYTLACDRTNTHVANLYDHLHPSVVRLIRTVIENGHKFGKHVGVCGEMAGDLEAIPVLMGLGLDEFSMSSATIPVAKQLIRQLDLTAMQELAERVMNVATPEQARSIVRAAVAKSSAIPKE